MHKYIFDLYLNRLAINSISEMNENSLSQISLIIKYSERNLNLFITSLKTKKAGEYTFISDSFIDRFLTSVDSTYDIKIIHLDAKLRYLKCDIEFDFPNFLRTISSYYILDEICVFLKEIGAEVIIEYKNLIISTQNKSFEIRKFGLIRVLNKGYYLVFNEKNITEKHKFEMQANFQQSSLAIKIMNGKSAVSLSKQNIKWEKPVNTIDLRKQVSAN